MRTLKFRAWDSKNKKFPFVGFHIIGECTAFDLINQYRLEELNDLEVTQFTGLKDVKGNDIYEGDIVKANPGAKFNVEFIDASFVLTFDGNKHEYNTLADSLVKACKLEVVGNRFEV